MEDTPQVKSFPALRTNSSRKYIYKMGKTVKCLERGGRRGVIEFREEGSRDFRRVVEGGGIFELGYRILY